MKKIKKILLITATHGDEKIGMEVISQLKQKGLSKYFDVLVANPLALSKNMRFVDVDMNRSYPGSKKASLYEKKRACENLKIAQGYKYVIDIHEANCGKDDFIIVPRKKLSKVFPLGLIHLKRILLWPDPKGPLGSVLANVIELEFGMKNRNRKQVVSKAEKIVSQFIGRVFGLIKNKRPYKSKEVYYVYGKLKQGELAVNINSLRDFKEAKNSHEGFLPLLVGQYLKDGIVCYKMRRIR